MKHPITAAFAPGWPGSEPRWTSSAKSGVGTSLSAASHVWFTLSHGILNEIYYSRLDSPCTRDIGDYQRIVQIIVQRMGLREERTVWLDSPRCKLRLS